MKKKLLILVTAILCSAGLVAMSTENTFASVSCIGAGSGAWSKEYCAAKLYRGYADVKTKCKGSAANKGTCEGAVSSNITCGAGVSGDSCTRAKRSFVDGVVDILMNNNVDPCGSMASGSSEQAECKKTNWKYYYKTESAANAENGGSTTTESGTEGSESSSSSSEVSSLEEPEEGSCSSILPDSWCSKNDDQGIREIIKLIINIMTGMVVVAGTIGVIFCGVMWMTARENEGQVATAKKRLFEIVIGVVAWVLIYALMNLLIPKSESDIRNQNFDAIMREIKK